MNKRIIALLTAAALALSLCACGRKKAASGASVEVTEEAQDAEERPEVIRVDINMSNFYDYFIYREYKSAVKNTDGEEITSLQILYGYALRDGFTAAASGEYISDLNITFTATGVVNKGSYTINFDTLEYTGTTESTERVQIEESLCFWPKGNRTEVWAYGNYSKAYVTYLTDFTVKGVSGCIYLKNDF